MLRIKTQISPGMLSKIASRRGFNTRQASYSRFQNHHLGFVMFCGLCSFVFCSNAQEHSEWLRGAAQGQRWGFLTRGQRRLRPAGPLPAATPAPIHWAGGFVPITRVSFEAIAFSGGCLKRNVIRLSLTLCWFARSSPLPMVSLTPGCPVPRFPPPVTQGGWRRLLRAGWEIQVHGICAPARSSPLHGKMPDDAGSLM